MEDGHLNTRHSTEIAGTKGFDPELGPMDDVASFDTDESMSMSSSSVGSFDGENGSTSIIADIDADKESDHLPSFVFACPVEADLSREVSANVYDATDFGSVEEFVTARVKFASEEGSFLVCNLAPIMNQVHLWKKELPMVEPFYAVKCHPDPVVLRLLSSMGCGFDCASMGEIDLVVNGLGEDLNFGARGLSAKKIVYANPAKMRSHIKFAADHDVRMTVFDGEDELLKIASMGGHHKFDLLLRLTTDDKASVCQFSKKFGCPVSEAMNLLKLAQSLGLHVAGVSFHVGSGCGDAAAYTKALSDSRKVFDMGLSLGMAPMSVVDIGGGFPGDSGGYGGPGMPTFGELAATIREGVAAFGVGLGRPLEDIRFIAEPGRYFVSASTTVATKVYARRGGHENHQALYVDDGVYGSFNNILYDHCHPVPRKLMLGPPESACIPTAVFGPTCDGLDQMAFLESTRLPRCYEDDWLIWENMGAYTHTASFVFNGYTHFPSKLYIFV